jgi:hypothetical protein
VRLPSPPSQWARADARSRATPAGCVPPDRHVPGPQRGDALVVGRMLALVLFKDQGQLRDFPNGPATSRCPANGSFPSQPSPAVNITHLACLVSRLGLDGQHQCSYAERNIWCEPQ